MVLDFEIKYSKKTGKAFKTLLTILAFCFIGVSQAQLVLEAPLSKNLNLAPFSSYINTGDEINTIQELLISKDTIEFKPLTLLGSDVGFTVDNYWIHFSVDNRTPDAQVYFLQTARPVTDIVNLYLIDEKGGIISQNNGDVMPYSEKGIPSRNNIFKINLPKDSEVTAYVLLKSDGEALESTLNLMPENELLMATYKNQLFNGVFYGVLLLAFILYLFFFFGLQSSVFLWYSLYILFVGLMQFSLDGYFHQYITPNGGWLNDKAVLLVALLSILFFLQYTREFLELPKTTRFFPPLFNVLQLVLGIAIGGLIIFPNNIHNIYPLANLMGLISILTVLMVIGYKMFKRERVDPFFSSGILFLVFGFVVFILKNLSVIPLTFFAENGPKFGTGIEIVFLSISMSNKIKDLRIDNELNQRIALQRERDLNEMKSYFLSNLSHELRTPLNLIMGIASSMEKNKGEMDATEQAQLIMSSSKSLLSSINDIMDFTTIEKGEFNLKESTFDLHELLRSLEKNISLNAKEKGLVFSFPDLNRVPKIILGDSEKLEQILTNLLNNALKFTNSGGFELSLKQNRTENGRTWITFNISDTGIGISEEKVITAFESFTKHSFGDTREFEGLGLGLFITKSCVDICGGTISMKNNSDGGTTCRVDLPFEIITQNESEKLELDNTNILLVEDNKLNQMVIKMFVKKWKGTTLTIANNGKEGLDELARNTFDVVLMDLQMPIMDGFEAIEKIRANHLDAINSQIPIIVLTADTTSDSFKRTKILGVDDYMNKPILEDVLLQKIYTVIKKQLKTAG